MHYRHKHPFPTKCSTVHASARSRWLLPTYSRHKDRWRIPPKLRCRYKILLPRCHRQAGSMVKLAVLSPAGKVTLSGIWKQSALRLVGIRRTVASSSAFSRATNHAERLIACSFACRKDIFGIIGHKRCLDAIAAYRTGRIILCLFGTRAESQRPVPRNEAIKLFLIIGFIIYSS